MKIRVIGNDLEVSALGLGCMGMSGAYGPPADQQEMIKLIPVAHDRGLTLFDSAEAYGPFTNETLLGEALQPIRDSVVIAAGFGVDLDGDTGASVHGMNSRPEHIRAVTEAALKRVRTDRIEILYQQRVHPNVPITDTAGVVRDLIAESK